jgi:hypothetical protein
MTTAASAAGSASGPARTTGSQRLAAAISDALDAREARQRDAAERAEFERFRNNRANQNANEPALTARGRNVLVVLAVIAAFVLLAVYLSRQSVPTSPVPTPAPISTPSIPYQEGVIKLDVNGKIIEHTGTPVGKKFSELTAPGKSALCTPPKRLQPKILSNGQKDCWKRPDGRTECNLDCR